MLKWLKGKIVDFWGAAVGYGEDAHVIWYPVTHYQAEVSDDLWRGSRLRKDDYDDLKKRGFRSIVNFCKENDEDRELAIRAGLVPYRIPVIDNTVPTVDQINAFLAIVKDKAACPVYCHCEAGKGRTGVFVACYRIDVQYWKNEEALAEAKKIGLAMPDQEQFILDFKPPNDFLCPEDARCPICTEKRTSEITKWMLGVTKGIVPHDYSKGPHAYCDEDNDIVYVRLKDCSCVAEWIGPDQTAIDVETSSRNREEIVGCSIWCNPHDPRVAENFAKYEEKKGLSPGSLNSLLDLAKDAYDKAKATDERH